MNILKLGGFGAIIFLFLLGTLFSIIAYFSPWLVPQPETDDKDRPGIVSIGLRLACFRNNFKFRSPDHGVSFDSCSTNQRDSAKFNTIPDELWSPDWFQMVQNMQLSAILLSIICLLIMAGYFAIYILESKVRKKKGRPQTCLLLSKCGLGLWFILTLVLGVLEMAAPMSFYANYERDRANFYPTDNNFQSFQFGVGFGLAIGSSLCMVISTVLGTFIFILMCRKYLTMILNPNRDDDYRTDDAYADSRSQEMDRLSDQETPKPAPRRSIIVEKDEDPAEVIENYNSEPVRGSQYEPDTPDKSDGRPMPRPRSSHGTSLVGSSREPSIARDASYPDDLSRKESRSRPDSSRDDQSYQDDRRSQASSRPSSRSPVKPQFKYDYMPGHGYVSRSAFPAAAPQSSASVHLSPSTPTGSGAYYHPPSQRSPVPSDVESVSVRSDRNFSVSKSSNYRTSIQEPPEPTRVVQPNTKKTDAKNSRYTPSW